LARVEAALAEQAKVKVKSKRIKRRKK